MKGHKTEITPELIERVIRAYTVKKMSFQAIHKLVCPRDIAVKILDDAGIKRNKYDVNRVLTDHK